MKGFTLIEVIISTGIMTILMGLGFASFRDYQRRQELIAEGRTLENNLRLAQASAFSGQKPTLTPPSVCTSFDGMKFELTSSTTYTIAYVCNGNQDEFNAVTYTLSPNMTIVGSGTSGSVIFKALGHGTDLVSGAKFTLTLTQNTTGATTTITITSGGEIK